MKYVNTKTRAIIDSPCTISGGDWEPVEGKVSENMKSEDFKKEAETEKTQSNGDTPTKEEIMKELDAMGIEYDKKAKKEELFELMKGE